MIVECPHCHEYIWIDEINCRIFRHAVFKRTFQCIPPHSSKEECDRFLNEGMVYGCTKPFMLHERDGKWVPEVCDYI